jgi:hypothetical protein
VQAEQQLLAAPPLTGTDRPNVESEARRPWDVHFGGNDRQMSDAHSEPCPVTRVRRRKLRGSLDDDPTDMLASPGGTWDGQRERDVLGLTWLQEDPANGQSYPTAASRRGFVEPR